MFVSALQSDPFNDRFELDTVDAILFLNYFFAVANNTYEKKQPHSSLGIVTKPRHQLVSINISLLEIM